MEIAVPSTETELINWSHGQTGAERLAASILRLEGFEGIDPQAPYGGPDGGKDILCTKDGQSFVGAAYFPKGQQKTKDIEKKFTADLKASLKHKRDGFIFITNQHLTPTERAGLENKASAAGKLCIIYYRERLRIALDSPAGYGLRLQHLGIAMRPEEQFAYFASSENAVAKALERQSAAIERLTDRIQSLGAMQLEVAAHTVNATEMLLRGEKPDVPRMLSEAAEKVSLPRTGFISEDLGPPLIQLVHRLVVPGTQIAGRLRTTQVWLMDPTGQLDAVFEPPPWEQIPQLLAALTQEWRTRFPAIASGDRDEKIFESARFFHGLLEIHPFVDGNGRTARALLAAIIRDLFPSNDDIVIQKGPEYYRALRLADAADFSELALLISAAIAEVELR